VVHVINTGDSCGISLNEIVGIREGTLISAVLVGSLVKGISKLFPEKKKN